MSEWKKSACILCSINCGIEVQLDGREITKIRGDKAHPASKGYTCEKPTRLNFYQNGKHRLNSPMRRNADGTFEAVEWDIAIQEIADRFAAIRDTHGGDKIMYYGGGGQGNHLCGAYAGATRAALGITYRSNALAQEKTGEFWVDGQLFGHTRCHTTGDFENAQVAVFWGKNPWHSHGFPRARNVLRTIAKDPNRSLIVVDPRRTETAELADHHLQLLPGGDAFLLSAMLKILLEEDWLEHDFLDAHANDLATLSAALADISIAEYCARAGLEELQVREVTQIIAQADSASIFEDLGIQQAPHSTLCSYLEKLLYLLTGNFGKAGSMNLHTSFGSGISSSNSEGPQRTPVTGEQIIIDLMPCNIIPDEILTDHPDRFRAMLVESANPVHSLADSARMREALRVLDFVVVIDVAMTETAQEADYVLPAASQFEKWEATFFNLEFPHNVFHLRAPIMEPLPGTLPEAEIHKRLVHALGALQDEDLTELQAAAKKGREAYAMAFFQALQEKPQLKAALPVVLYETLGPALPSGHEQAAVLWGLAHSCAGRYAEAVHRAGIEGEGLALGENLFDAVLNSRSGVTFTVDEYEETWSRLATSDKRIRLAVEPLLEELAKLKDEDPRQTPDEFPFVLAAGERRSGTANTIYRNPEWRRKDKAGALRMNPDDAATLGIDDGGLARVTTKRGSLQTVVEITDTLRRGHITLPNGLGLHYPDEREENTLHGVPPNELTATEDRDWLAGTPWHKHVRARVERVSG